MRIELVGVERLVVVIYGQFAIEARDVITGEEVGRNLMLPWFTSQNREIK